MACAPTAIARLVCPIGIDGIGSKWPAAIAVAVAAQVLQDPSRRRDGARDSAAGVGPRCRLHGLCRRVLRIAMAVAPR